MSTIRVRYILQNVWSSSSAEERDLANDEREVFTDALEEQQVIVVKLAAGAVDVPAPFTLLSEAKILSMRAESQDPNLLPGEVTFKKNSVMGEANRLVPLPDAREATFHTTTAGLTGLFFSNPSLVAMKIWVRVAGID